MRHVLLIGFGPFPGAPFNPSAILVKALARRRRPAFAEVIRMTHVLAATYATIDRDLPKLFAEKPDIVLMFSLAERRRELCIETRARNAVSVLLPDASGCRPRPRGHFARWTSDAARRRAVRQLARRVARLSAAGALIARCRQISVQLRLLARPGARSRRPAAGPVHSHSPIRFQRRRRGHRAPSFRSLVAAAERLLIALIAASRR